MYLLVGMIGAVVAACTIGAAQLVGGTLFQRRIPLSNATVLAILVLAIAAFTVVGVFQGRQSSWGLDLIVAGYLFSSVPVSLLWRKGGRDRSVPAARPEPA